MALVTPSVSRSSEPPTSGRRGTVSDWREFGQRRYRRFRVLAVAQGFIGSLSGPAIIIPLLLGLGAHPALATLLAVLPVIGTTVQRFVPALLDRSDGNLRGLVILATTVGEPRGLYLAVVVTLAAMGVLPTWAAIALIGLLMGALGAMGATSYGLLQAWYQIVLPDERRRVVTPRLGAIALGIGSVVLLPFALAIDRLVTAFGVWAYVAPLGLAGLGGIVAAVMVRTLPPPGRVRVPRAAAAFAGPNEDRLRMLARVLNLAGLSAGLAPFLSVYAMTVLRTGPGFAIAVSAVSSAALVASSVWVSGHLRGGSSSRLLRTSMLLRGAALWSGVLAFPGNPVAPLVLIVVAILMAAGDSAGQLSANERLFRLATGPSVIAFQSGNVVRNVAAYGIGLLGGALVMLFGGYPSFALLFVASGTTRFVAARQTEVTPPVAAAG